MGDGEEEGFEPSDISGMEDEAGGDDEWAEVGPFGVPEGAEPDAAEGAGEAPVVVVPGTAPGAAHASPEPEEEPVPEGPPPLFHTLFTPSWKSVEEEEPGVEGPAEDEKVNIAILKGDHETVPAAARGRVSGLILNFEVDDVDAEFARAEAGGLPIHLALRDEPFGQRHFITADPNGVLIDVIKPIPPSDEFLAKYAEGAAAG